MSKRNKEEQTFALLYENGVAEILDYDGQGETRNLKDIVSIMACELVIAHENKSISKRRYTKERIAVINTLCKVIEVTR